MPLLYQTSALLDAVRQAKRRNNPPRYPTSFKKVMDEISKWADPKMDWLSQNAKTEKAIKNGRPYRGKKTWITFGLNLMPAREALKFFTKPKQGGGRQWNFARLKEFNVTQQDITKMGDMCPGATEGCKMVCLSSAGRMAQTGPIAASVKRQVTLKKNRKAFLIILVAGIARLSARARKLNAGLGIRLNVLSDLPWESYRVTLDKDMAQYLRDYGIKKAQAKTYKNLMELFPHVQFYDYTKVKTRMDKFLRGNLPKNYHLTWSLAETSDNRKEALKVLRTKKTTVSVPFAVYGRTEKPLPKQLTIVHSDQPYTFKVIDADKHDFRPIDPPGTISGLRFKIPKKPSLKGMQTEKKIQLAQGFVLPNDKHVIIRTT